MLIGAHVSTAGGLVNAVGRGDEIGASAIQIFNQSPRAWRPTRYTDDDFAEFREAMTESSVESVIIHAVYLINPATPDKELRRKSLESLTHALSIGDGIGATGVVLHPGSRKDAELIPAMIRSGEVIEEALDETEACPVLIEQMAGHKGILGHTFEEIAAITEAAGGGPRVGACLDSCHMFAAGYDIRTPESIARVVDDLEEVVGKTRLKALHINDSKDPFGSKKDRHEDIGEGQIGEKSMSWFLSEPRFDDLTATMETPGRHKEGVAASDVDLVRKLRARGLKNRKAREKRSKSG
jgi:deoxyribonuclease-4